MNFAKTATLVWLCSVCLRTAVADDRELGKRLDQVIDRAITEKKIVGLVALVARDGRIVYHRAAGLADRETGRPMREDEVFRLASMSKVIVTAAALALVEQGRLRLDDPVTKWLPTFRPKLADGREPTITIHQLLTHTAGLTYGFLEGEDGPYHRANVSDGLDQPGLSLDENLRRIATVPLSFEPGTAWNYSVATDVLGAVLENVAQAPLSEVVAQLVTGPLGMKTTGFYAHTPARLATPYGDGSPEPIRMSDPYLVKSGKTTRYRYAPSRVFDRKSFPSAGAGLIGTASDYVTYLETIRKGGSPILKPETVRKMTTNRIGDLPFEGRGWGFGYGFAVLLDKTKTAAPHDLGTYQWSGAYGSHFFVNPVRQLTVVVLTNTAVAGMIGTFPNDLRAAVYAEEHGTAK